MQHMRLPLLVFSSQIFFLILEDYAFYASMERARIVSCIYRAR